MTTALFTLPLLLPTRTTPSLLLLLYPGAHPATSSSVTTAPLKHQHGIRHIPRYRTTF